MQGPIVVPFTSKTWLIIGRGMTGATGNYYAGLHEFEDMAFVVNLLRPDDLFIDIGANIGSYSLLASGHAGASSVSVEPLPTTFAHLRENVRYNNLDDLIALHNVGIGDSETTLRFTATLDTVNHVAAESDSESETVEVPVVRMESLLQGLSPLCIKIDVEGFEKKVIDGGASVLRSDLLRAVLMELNGSGDRYGFSDDEIHQKMLSFGFLPFRYDPWTRLLHQLNDRNRVSGNTLYLRDVEFVQGRLSTAPEIELPWRTISRNRVSKTV